MCTRRKLKVYVFKSKVVIFIRRETELVGFAISYRISNNSEQKCNIGMGCEMLEEVRDFECLGSVLWKI